MQSRPYPAIFRNDLGFTLLIAASLGIAYTAVQLSGGSPSPFNHVAYLPILTAAHR